MPKITSASVPEHLAAQRAALLRAGEEILLSSGLAGFTPTSVSRLAGVARTSFYDYFPTKDDLLAAIAIDAMEKWDAEIQGALRDVPPGLPSLKAFVDATMRMTAEGNHAIAEIVRDAEFSPTKLDELMLLHDALFRPVIQVLGSLGVEATHTSAMLIHGVLGAGVQLVTHGIDHELVAADVLRLLTQGIVE